MVRGLIGKATRWLGLGAAAMVLAACGGGGGGCVDSFGGNACNGNGGGGGGGTPQAADLVVVLSANTLVNSGAQTLTATVTALDSNRNALPGVAVTLSADNGGVVTLGEGGSVTDENGVVTATVGIGSDRTNRTIQVSAVAGSASAAASFSVISSASDAVPTSIELIASSTTVGTGGDQVSIQAFVKDASNNTMPGTPVSFTSSTGTLSGAPLVTDAAGVASAQFSAGSNKANRSATITVSAGTVQSALTLPIVGSKLTVSGTSSLTLGSSANYTVLAVDSKGNALPNVTITATSALGNPISLASATTDANGQVQASYAAVLAGDDNISFAGAGASVTQATSVSGEDFVIVAPAAGAQIGVGDSQAVTVRYRVSGVGQAGRTILFAATGGTLSSSSAVTNAQGVASVTLSSASAGPVTIQANLDGGAASASQQVVIVGKTPDQLVLQANQSTIAPNQAGSSTSQTPITAKVTDAAGNPVPGKTVNFSRVTDPSGGSLPQASAVTDSNGQASVPYVAGPESTANNGVVLQASVADAPAVTGQATLTVSRTALFITLGTGNEIDNVDPQTYRKDWVAYVTDSNGVAVSGVTLTLKVLPTAYLRGNLTRGADDTWEYQSDIYQCPNEDLNENGTLDPGEDTNGDGVLWPGNVISVSPGTVQTDANGRATISLIYAESFAPWVEVKLTATARVSGTESRRDSIFIVDGSQEDFSAGNVPAAVVSPFGNDTDPLPLAGCVRVI